MTHALSDVQRWLSFAVSVLVLSGCSGNRAVTFTSGGMTHTFVEGKEAGLRDFPLPIYPHATETGSVSASGNRPNPFSAGEEDSHFLMLSSADSIAQVSRFYQVELKSRGWQIENVQTLPRLVNITAENKEMEASVMVSNEGEHTTISLSAGRILEGSPTLDTSSGDRPSKLTPPTD